MKNPIIVCIVILLSIAVSPKAYPVNTQKMIDQLAEDTTSLSQIQSILNHELTVDGAVQIALMKNPSLQSTYEELGIAKADILDAGLVKNPIIGISARFPHESPGKLDTEFSIEQNFIDWILRPSRKKLADAEYMKVKLMVTNATRTLRSEVQSTFYHLQGKQQVLDMQQQVLQTAESAAEFAQRQFDAGNITELALVNEQANYNTIKLDVTQAELEITSAREELNRLMGLPGDNQHWKIGNQLPPLPEKEFLLENLLSLATAQRLDLEVTRQENMVLTQRLVLNRKLTINTLDIGVSSEHGPDGLNVTGPFVRFDLPLINQRQGDIARLKSQLLQNQRNQKALEGDITSEVRQAFTKLQTIRKKINLYREKIIPLRKKILEQTQLNYNAMLSGVYTLLQTKQEEVNAQKDYIEFQRDYWIAWSELERSVGGQFDIPQNDKSKSEPVSSETEIQQSRHHQH